MLSFGSCNSVARSCEVHCNCPFEDASYSMYATDCLQFSIIICPMSSMVQIAACGYLSLNRDDIGPDLL